MRVRFRRVRAIRPLLTVMAFVVILAGTLASTASAQVTTTVLGTVKDQQSGVLPGATVVLISETKGTKSEPVVTNASGDFVLPSVPPDTYTLQVEMPSFKTLKRSGLTFGGDPRIALGTLTLEVGGQEEIVNVTGESPMIQAASGERSFTVDSTAVDNLPIANRNFTSLATLAPGVDITGAVGVSRVGGGGDSNIVMDGVSTSSPGNNAIMIRLNTESVASVKVVTSGYQAEYGRASGVQVTSVTKGGSNRFHGSVYDVERNSDWNSNSRTNILNGDPKTVAKERDFGFSVGGPVGKPGGTNKLFFFFSQEFEPRSSGNDVARFRMPTALERAGDFSQSTDNLGSPYPYIKNPALNGACTATDQTACYRADGVLGRIPQSDLYAPGLALLNMFPQPTITNIPAGQAFNYQLTRPIEDATGYQPVLRMDYQPTSVLRGTYRLALQGQRADQVFNGTLPGFNDTQMTHPTITTQVMSVNYTIRPTMLLEGSYGRTRNELSGCGLGGGNVPGPTFCTAGFPVSPLANPANAGIAGIPLIYPDARVVDPQFYTFRAMEQLQSPIWDGNRILLPPLVQWGSRIANAPPQNLLNSFYNTSLVEDFSASLPILKGRHTIKTGVFRLKQFQAQITGGAGNAIGTLSFSQDTPGANPFDTSFGFANAAIGTFSSYSQNSVFSEYSSDIRNLDFYAQDNWKTNSRLTLDYGLRFVHQVPEHDKFLRASNFLPEEWTLGAAPLLYVPGCVGGANPCTGTNRQAMNPATGQLLGPTSAVAIGTVIPGTGNSLNGLHQLGQGIVENGYKWPGLAIAPRFGAAYDPTGNQQIVLRGSVGLFFDRTAANATRAAGSNPPVSDSATLRYGKLQSLTTGQSIKGAPTLGGAWVYDSPDLPSSVQWNTGAQIALPYAAALDVSYVGQHSYAQAVSANINAVDFGAAFLSQNQDRTLAANATPGATAFSADLLRAMRGYGTITQNQQTGWRTFHSLQFSINRRFKNGLSFGFNDTWSLYDHQSTAPRFEHGPDRMAVQRADQAQADELLGTAVSQVHLMRGNFVWDLPDLQSAAAGLKAMGWVVNDWQLSGFWTGRTGTPYAVNFSYQNGGNSVNLTGSADYPARVVIVGDTGDGCSGDIHRAFNTSAFQGPATGSVGLESGNGYLRNCFTSTLDLSVMRMFRLGKARTAQIRLDLFNAPNAAAITGVQNTMNMNSPQTPTTITNLPYDANGNLIDSRSRPRGAGFGVANAYQAPRSIQLQLRFSF
jgi:hypothetical protein